MDIRKLQRAIVDGLEDVKGQNIAVFNTEHLSPLFERVIIASGTSNRQTKALAASVRDAVKASGHGVLRTEGEANGEWIIVDCGAAVAHIMQPAIRQYYHLEEIWGDKPIRLKFGAPKPAEREEKVEAKPAKFAKPATPTLRRSSAAKTAIRAAEQEAKAAKAPARKAPARKTSKGSTSATARTPVKVIGKPAPRKPAAKSAAAKKPARKAAPRRP